MSKPELVFFGKRHQQVQKFRQKQVSELQGFEKAISAACRGLTVKKLWIFEHEPPWFRELFWEVDIGSL